MLAVDVYNKPATSFKSGAYIVLMVIAWTSLLHAIFERRKTPYYYRKKNSKRYEKIGGDKKAWELTECVGTYYGSNNPPERKNLELFIELRNKIEHRFLPQLDPEIAGESQALLMNYEEVLVSEFGARYALASDLAFPLQVTRIRSAGRSTAQKKLQAKEFGRVKSFLDQYRAGLDPEVWNGSQFSFRVFLIPKIGNRPDVLVQREMERGRSPLVSVPPFGVGIVKAPRYTDSMRIWKQRKEQVPALPFIVSMSPPGYPSAPKSAFRI